MRETPNLLLKLPDPTDYVLVEDLNENFTKLDTEIAKITDEETGVEAKLTKHLDERVATMHFAVRDASLTGNQTISNIFKAKTIRIYAVVDETTKFSVGEWSESYLEEGTHSRGDGGTFVYSGKNIIYIRDSHGNATIGNIRNVTENSFDIKWTHEGVGASGNISMQIAVGGHGE